MEQKIKRVSLADRKKIALSSTLNRFWRRREDLRSLARQGPGRCRHCGGEPCGASWGPVKGEESALCCDRCSHGAVARWRPTHVLWLDKKAFFVQEVPIGRAGAVYLRQDGVSWFTRLGVDHFFLGVKLGVAEFARFKVSDPNGWPAGMKAEAMAVDIDDEAFEHGQEFEDDSEEDAGEDQSEDEAEDEDEDEDDVDDDTELEEGDDDEVDAADGSDDAGDGEEDEDDDDEEDEDDDDEDDGTGN